MVWKKRWPEVRRPHRLLLCSLLGAGLLVALFPWSATLTVPGVARAERQQIVYSPQPARVLQIHPGSDVKAGTPLVLLDMPDLHDRQARTQASVSALASQLPGLLGQEEGLDVQQATAQRLQEQLAESQAIREEVARLNLKAEFSGQWRDVDPHLRAGSWVDMRTPLGVLVDPSRWVVDAYVDQQQVHRISAGSTAHFWPQHRGRPLKATVLAVDSTRSERLPYPMLDARHGGSIATQPHQQQSMPLQPMYRVRLLLQQPLPQQREMRGMVDISAQRSSWLLHQLQNGLAVIIRESGF